MLDKKKHLSSSETISHYKEMIVLLKETSSGLNVSEISKVLKISRNTVSVYLAKLEGAGKVRIRRVGMAKLYSLKPEFRTKLTIKGRPLKNIML